MTTDAQTSTNAQEAVMGVVSCGLFAFVVSYAILFTMKKAMGGIRVTEEEELMGLDMSEHGNYGYPEQMVLEESKSLN